MSLDSVIAQAGRSVLEGELLDRPRLLSLIEPARQDVHELLYWAWQVRKKSFGNKVVFCSIIAGKLGGCGEDCKWCAQSAAHARTATAPPGLEKTKRAELSDIQSAARHAAQSGAGCFSIVNSGRRPSRRDLDDVTAALGQLRQEGLTSQGMCLSASLGELTAETARQLAAAGVTRYHHNLETSRRFYSQVVSTHSYDDRLKTLQVARQAGLEVCCGGLMGMGETWEDRIDLALTLRDDVHATISPLNFLHPIAGTPLENAQPISPREILMTIALFRLAMPRTDLKIAGGRQVNLRELQSWMFYAGATSVLVGNYLTTIGRAVEQDIQLVNDLGLEVVPGFGTL
jgi:biotin synthase